MGFILIIIILILSVVIHEVAHGYSALSQGDPTAKYAGRLTLNPIKHLDLFGSFIVPALLFLLSAGVILGWAKPVPINPYNFKNQKWGEAWVAATGPLSNFFIAIIFGLLIRFSLAYDIFQDAIPLMGLIVVINLILGIFNLIPIPPLDGSKILFSILPSSFDELRITLERYGLFIVLFVVLLFSATIFFVINIILVWAFALLTGDPSVLSEVFQFFQ